MTFRNFVKSYMEYGTDEEKAWVVVSLIFLKYYNDDETFEKMLDEEIGGNQATSNRCNCDNTIVEKEKSCEELFAESMSAQHQINLLRYLKEC